jgi:CcmD family protein
MGILLATYAVAWAVVSAYVVRLAARSNRLSRRVERLEKRSENDQGQRAMLQRLAG